MRALTVVAVVLLGAFLGLDLAFARGWGGACGIELAASVAGLPCRPAGWAVVLAVLGGAVAELLVAGVLINRASRRFFWGR